MKRLLDTTTCCGMQVLSELYLVMCNPRSQLVIDRIHVLALGQVQALPLMVEPAIDIDAPPPVQADVQGQESLSAVPAAGDHHSHLHTCSMTAAAAA